MSTTLKDLINRQWKDFTAYRLNPDLPELQKAALDRLAASAAETAEEAKRELTRLRMDESGVAR